MASQEVGIFFFLISFFYKLKCTGGKVKKFFFEKSAILDPPGRYTGNNFLFKGGLTTNGLVGRVSVLSVGGQGFKSLTGSFQRL